MAKIKLINDVELFYAIADLVVSAKKTLVIIYPDLSNIEHLLEKIQDLRNREVDVYVVTRPHDSTPSHQKSISFLSKIGCKIFTDELVKARIIVCDQSRMLLSSADLSKTANDKSYDAGVLTTDKGVINATLDYAEKIMRIITK
ncbi:MAG: phospholipase D-like domain-containing protein, partial [Candidatus Odinarchaeia archaeon]